jgi:thymidylate kinase
MKHVQDNDEEYRWLMRDLDIDESVRKLTKYFPEIPPADFHAARELLPQNGHWLEKIRLGLKFRKAINKYLRFGPVKQYLMTFIALTKMAINKFSKKQKHMHMQTGGKIIALVGPQATGKSTLASSIQAWLGQELSVQCIHAGKPPSTILTWLPNNLIPLARKLFTGYATVKIEKEAEENEQHDFPLIFIIRRVMLAHDRHRLLRRAYRQSRNGIIIISDRYPSDEIGAIDGATFRDESIKQQRSSLKRFLMRLERKIYRDICPPDLVLQLTVSVEKAVLRNITRDKEGDQTTEYVQMRHTMKYTPRFQRCPVIKISTDRDFQETLIDVKQHVWKHIYNHDIGVTNE